MSDISKKSYNDYRKKLLNQVAKHADLKENELLIRLALAVLANESKAVDPAHTGRAIDPSCYHSSHLFAVLQSIQRKNPNQLCKPAIKNIGVYGAETGDETKITEQALRAILSRASDCDYILNVQRSILPDSLCEKLIAADSAQKFNLEQLIKIVQVYLSEKTETPARPPAPPTIREIGRAETRLPAFAHNNYSYFPNNHV